MYLIEKVHLSKETKDGRCKQIFGEEPLGKENSQCKGLKVSMPDVLENSKETSVAGSD